MTLKRYRQAEGSRFMIEEPVAQIQRRALPAGLGAIHEARNGGNIKGRQRCSDLDPEILDGHEFQLKLLAESLVGPGLFRESSRRHSLEFTFAGTTDVGANHEAVDVLGVDAFGKPASRPQERPQHRRPDCPCGNAHSGFPRAIDVTQDVRSTDASLSRADGRLSRSSQAMEGKPQ